MIAFLGAAAILPKMETGLQLLMTDGAVQVTFRPCLSEEQYAAFLVLVEHITTKEELCAAGESFAARLGLEFACDDLSV